MKILNNLSIFWLLIIGNPSIEIWRFLLGTFFSLISGYWKTPKSLDFLNFAFWRNFANKKKAADAPPPEITLRRSFSLSLSLSLVLLLTCVFPFLFFLSSSAALGERAEKNNDNGKDPALFSSTFATLLL
jgi:hypothetical protein